MKHNSPTLDTRHCSLQSKTFTVVATEITIFFRSCSPLVALLGSNYVLTSGIEFTMADDRETTPTSDVEDDNVRIEIEVHETDDKYTCSDCGHTDKFDYTTSEDEAFCRECQHKKCGDCEKSD
ncbi:hypothetical protein F5B21DRAFT_459722 [Xylaria acuta]|nr:hypothetical protein F5B21DRAFT_459722 [Xylaria acuta]